MNKRQKKKLKKRDGYFHYKKYHYWKRTDVDTAKIDQIDKSGEPTKLIKYYDGPLTDKCSCCWSG